MAVRRSSRDKTDADVGAGAAPVIHDHSLAETVAELLREYAANHIRCAAWRERHDNAQRARRILLRKGKFASRRQHGGN